MIIQSVGARPELPVGMLRPDGTITRHFKLGPVTGRVHLAVGADGNKNQGVSTTRLLHLTLEELGDTGRPTETMVRRLSVVDREYLSWMHHVRRLAGKPLSVSAKCSNESCGCDMEVDIPAQEVEVRILEDGDTSVIDVKDPIRGDTHKERVFVFDHPEYGRARFRLLTGIDEERNIQYHESNKAEGHLRDLHAGLVDLDGKTLDFEAFTSLDMLCLDWLAAAAGAVDIGVSRIASATCPDCGGVTRITITPFELMAPLLTRTVPPPYAIRSSS